MYATKRTTYALLAFVGLAILFTVLLLLVSPKNTGAQEPPSTINLGSFTVTQDTNPEDNKQAHAFRYDVYFNGALVDDFELLDDGTTGERFHLMEPGEYTIRQQTPDGYAAPTVSCRGVAEHVLANGVRFDLEAGDVVRCDFVNERAPTPTATATATSTPTQTPTPEPTATPAPQTREVGCADGSVKVVPVSFTGVVCQAILPTTVPTVTPVLTTVPQGSVRITAPNTGSGGLLK